MQPALLGSPRDLKEFLLPTSNARTFCSTLGQQEENPDPLLSWSSVCSSSEEHWWDVCPAGLRGCVTSVPGGGWQQGGHTSGCEHCCAPGSKRSCAHLGMLPAWFMPTFMPKLNTTCISASCSFPKAQFS